MLRQVAALAALAALACARAPRPRSPELAAARERYVALVARWADDAYGRPEMDEVVALLSRVAPDSADAELAADLAGRIAEGRRQVEARRAAHDQMVAAAGPAKWIAPPPEPPAAPATGSSGAPPLAPGVALDDFKASHGDCFELKTPLQIEAPDGGARAGEAWGLKADPACGSRHPAEAGAYVLFADGRLVEVRPASEARTVELRTTVQVPMLRLPDGGMEPVDGGVVSAPDGGAR